MTTRLKRAVGASRRRDVTLQRKAISDDRVFEGYGSVFGNLDSYNEIVAPGAFKESLAEHQAEGTLPALLSQHKSADAIGVYQEMREDDYGLFVRGQLLTGVQEADETYIKLKAGALRGLSIGYAMREWKYDEESGVLTHTAVDLWEVSVVTFPANSAAGVNSVKSVDDWVSLKDAEAFLSQQYSNSEATAIVAKVKSMGIRSESVDPSPSVNGQGELVGLKGVFDDGAERLRQIINR